ncbi:hypothetical protein WHR41_00403 [Cladosporium halotolerans]|uniref:FAD-binding domain-containing protein n=1 Tax=Cladosporium halotolerans TaxID=1052096 RepID=A0AB34L1D0_9PEZI
MSAPKVLISGSGIAGSVFAFCLLRAYLKANITIVERAPGLRLTGASVDIRSNAVDIIKWAGVEQAVRDRSTHEAGMQLVRSDGTDIATIRATGRTDVQSITSEHEIFRGDLADIFLRPILDKVNLVFDETVENYEQHSDKVTVTFAKSKKVESYDLLVGADGLYSKTRGKMLGAKPSEHIHGGTEHVAFFTIKHDLLNGGLLAKGYSTTSGRTAILRPDPDPAGRTRAMLMKTVWPSDTNNRARLADALRSGSEAYKQLMEEMFADVGWLTPEILRAMCESDDFYCSTFAQTRSPKLQDGRVVLLGDAGHALPGLGTSLAITGAYVLAGEMLLNGADFTAATKRYEDLWLPYVKKQQSQESKLPMLLLNPQSAWGVAIRDVLFRLVVGSGFLELAMRASAMLGFSEAKLSMPEYPWPAIERVQQEVGV